MTNKNEKVKSKSFMVKGISAYITGVYSLQEAMYVCIQARWMITPKDLVEVDNIPENVPRYPLSKRPRFDPREPQCIDMNKEYEYLRESVI